MELALVAEGFHEMLMKVYGDGITSALLKDRCVRGHWGGLSDGQALLAQLWLCLFVVLHQKLIKVLLIQHCSR